jgi:NADH-quinone oxidoreductase subunit J
VTAVFYIASAIALVSTMLAVTRHNAVHALLYLVLSFISIALVFYILGAPFIAVLEVIIYAGAIMVLFLFVIMMLNLGERTLEQERAWFPRSMLVLPGMLSGILFLLILYTLLLEPGDSRTVDAIGPSEVGAALFGPYIIGVQLGGLLLLSALISATLLSRRLKFREKEIPPGGPGEGST